MAELSYFGWDEEHAVGYDETIIGSTGDFGEIDLTDDEVQHLISAWIELLNHGQHITLRVK